MRVSVTLLVLWALHAVVGAALAVPILWLGRNRVRWAAWQLLTPVVPFCLWVLLTLSPLSAGRRDVISLYEPFLISLVLPVLALLRVALGRRFSERVQSVSAATILSGIAVAAFFAVPLWTAPVGRGLTKFDRRIIDAHEQRYNYSCIPSSVEMVLKLMGRVPLSYYGLQDAWRNKADGSFHDFDGKTFSRLTFHQQFTMARDSAFPLTNLFATIDRELKAGRFVIVGLPAGNDFHNWVIYDEDANGEFLAVSKFQKWTIQRRHVKRTITEMRGTDLGIYEYAR
jgi:hypothetical protein